MLKIGVMNLGQQNTLNIETPQTNIAAGIILSMLFLFLLNGMNDYKTMWELIKPLLP
ncbi:MAG: hypothetical protein KA035_02830 [Candidatus Levybacteria bacterium]|nr:hypothetical protein [Candidatus Levybacteria bacterium]